jgi:ferrochelatase
MLRRFSSTASSKPMTGIVMLNMGGPSTVPEVGPFLHRLFTDGEIIQLGPLQSTLGPFIAKRRTPRIEQQYQEIGGSPIRRWTELQGKGMAEILDKIRPESAPHKFYIAFRYADPLTEETLLAMKNDGVERAVAFSQYPQYSCTTAGSSLNHLWRESARLGLQNSFKWSIIDRWNLYPGYVQAVAEGLVEGLKKFSSYDAAERAVIVFSSHSLPLKVVEKGDQYPQEMAATVSAVMDAVRKLGVNNSYIHAWQSKVGYLPWISPSTEHTLTGLGKQGHKEVLVVPLGFTSDHVETLFELDIEYSQVSKDHGIREYVRAPALNDNKTFIQSLADLVKEHLDSGRSHYSNQYPMNCPYCVNPTCRSILNPVQPFENLRTRNTRINA